MGPLYTRGTRCHIVYEGCSLMTLLIVPGIPLALIALICLAIWSNERHMHEGCKPFLWLFKRNHVQDKGYYCNTPGYGDIHDYGSDGILRRHGSVFVKCARCDTQFDLVKVHQHADHRTRAERIMGLTR